MQTNSGLAIAEGEFIFTMSEWMRPKYFLKITPTFTHQSSGESLELDLDLLNIFAFPTSEEKQKTKRNELYPELP